MSKSNTINSHNYPISLCLYKWNFHFLWMKWEKEDLINQININHTLHYQFIPFNSIPITMKSVFPKSDWLKSNQISFINQSIIHTIKYYLMTLIECSNSQLNGYERRKILQFKWFIPIEWILSKVYFIQLITIHYHTWTSFSVVIQTEAPLSTSHTLPFIQSIKHKSIHFLQTLIFNHQSFNSLQTISIKYTQIIPIMAVKYLCSWIVVLIRSQ